MIASSSNGRTADSDSVNLGSSPGEAANKKNPPEMVDFVVEMHSSWREPRFWFGADSWRKRVLSLANRLAKYEV